MNGPEMSARNTFSCLVRMLQLELSHVRFGPLWIFVASNKVLWTLNLQPQPMGDPQMKIKEPRFEPPPFERNLWMRSSIVIVSSLLVVSLLGIAALTVKPSKATQNIALRTLNRTDAFSVIKATRELNAFSLTLKNDSVKTITAFSISPAKEVTIIEEFIFAEAADTGVKPNQVFSKTYTVPSPLEPQLIEINALIFDDGTMEGDLSAARRIEDSRLGQQIQMRRAVKELQTYLTDRRTDVSELKVDLVKKLNASDDDTSRTLLELKPSRKDTNPQFSDSLREGLDNGRQNVLRNISEAEATGAPDGFIRLKATYERILSRL